MAFLTTAINYLIGALLGGVIIWAKTSVKNHTEKDKAYENAVKALTHDAFFRYCRYVLKEEELTTETLENLEHLHDSYKALGLNGTGEKLYEQCKALPLRMEK